MLNCGRPQLELQRTTGNTMLRPMFREGFACIFVVCLSAMSTMHIIGVDSVVLQASNGVSTLKQTSWNAYHLSKRQQPGTSAVSSSSAAVVGAGMEMTTNSPGENGGDSRALSVQNYWYVLLVLVIVVVVVFVCFCACFVKKKRQSHQTLRLERRSYQSPSSNPSTRQLSSTDERSLAINRQHTSSSLVDPTSSPGSISMDPTPIPSPQPSFTSSLRSARSSGRGSGRKRQRNHSPGHMSSGSEDTIKPNKSHSALSLGSTASSRSLGPSGGVPRVIRTESQSSGERSVRSAPSSHGHGRAHRRAASSTVVKITPIGGVVDDGSLHSASSMMSMASVGSNHSGRSNRSNVSNRSGVLTRSRSNSSPNTLVEVDVKVHFCNEQEREARSEIAAALAESARQLAQSAANFDQEEEDEERQRRGWYSKSLPHHSHSSLPHRLQLGTTHSLPLHGNKRRLFSSYSSTNLPLPHSREHVYTPNLPSSSGHTPPIASLDRPRHMVSIDHPNSAHYPYENYRRNSLSQRHHPHPPESPLMLSQNGRLSSPSQRSLSSNSEYAPGHYHNPPLPVHLRPQRLLSRRVSEPGDGRQDVLYQNHNPAFLNHTHSGRLRGINGSRQLSIASLDFHSPKSQSQKSHVPRLNGITNPSYSNHDLRSQFEDVGFRQELLDVNGMRNENGSDSNTSTLCGSSHSSTLDNKNRLSRVSEKSEHNENENEHINQDDQSSLCDEEGITNVNHNFTAQEQETGEAPSSVAKQRSYPPGHDERYLTMPNHYRKVMIQQSPLSILATPTTDPCPQAEHLASYPQPSPLSPSSSIEQDMTVSPVRQSPPSRRLKPKSESALKDASKQDKDTVSVGSTLPRSPTSSTCLSSQSVQSIQSAMQDEMTPNEENHPKLERQSSLPDVSLHQQQQQQQQQASNSSSSSPPPTRNMKTQSLPQSGSGLSNSMHDQLGGTATAAGSGNSLDSESLLKTNKSLSQVQELPATASTSVTVASFPSPTKNKASVTTTAGNDTVATAQAQVKVLNHEPSSQLSYPLQKLLAQPLSFDIENDDFEDLLEPQHSVNYHHHGNVYHHPHSHSNRLYHQHASSRGGTVHAPADFQQQLQQGFHRNQVPHHSLHLDHIRLPNHTLNHISFNPGRSVRTSPGLPSVSAAVPPPPHFGSITVDIDV